MHEAFQCKKEVVVQQIVFANEFYVYNVMVMWEKAHCFYALCTVKEILRINVSDHVTTCWAGRGKSGSVQGDVIPYLLWTR